MTAINASRDTLNNSNLSAFLCKSPHISSVQYCGGCSVHRGDNISTVGDIFSTVGDSFSTVEVAQYSGG